MEEREGEGDCGRPIAPPPPTMNFPPWCEDEFEVLRKLMKWGCYKVRSQRFAKRLTEEYDKREGGGAPLTDYPLFLPPAADISCGSFQIAVTGAADKREEDMLIIDKIEEEQEQEAAEEEEEDEEEEDILSVDTPPMSKEHWIRYFQQVEDSEGFDVDDFPGRTEDNLLGPLGGSYDNVTSVKIGRHAIDRYNARKKDAPIEFVRVVKIISKYAGWMPQYATLEGRDTGDGNKIKTYQALVLMAPGLGGYVLKMFRLKPSAEAPTSKGKKHPLGECCGECLRTNVVQDDEAGPEHETPLPPAKKPRVENNKEQPQPQSSANSSPSNDDCNDGYDSDDYDPDFMSHEDIMLREFEISLEAPVNGFASVEEAEEFWKKHYQSDNNHLDRKSPQGGPKYTREDVERYYEQLEDSQGFDVDYFPEMENLEFITPIRDEEVVNNRFTEHAKLAIEFHNKEEGTQLQLRKIIKVNCLNIVCCPHAYITFEAIDAADGVHDEPKTYQARILTIPGRVKVEEVRLKP